MHRRQYALIRCSVPALLEAWMGASRVIVDTNSIFAMRGRVGYTSRGNNWFVHRLAQRRARRSQKLPGKFFEVVVHELDPVPGLTALDAGYENGEWRAQQLASYMFDWLPEFALTYSEYASLNHVDAIPKIRRAAAVIYNTEKYGKRGEFGELLLHIAIRQTFHTVPAISKVYYKDAGNDTVKGFDAVHVIVSEKSLELWLGEAKFYEDAGQAVASVVQEIQQHTHRDYLRDEFTLIRNKIDPTWPHADRLKKLLDPNTSLDEVFDVACIPVLLTYDSNVVAAHVKKSDEFLAQLSDEVRAHHKKFCGALECKVRVHLFLLPMKTKKVLLAALHEMLQAWQKI